MKSERHVFFEELQKEYPFCVATALDVISQHYPLIPASMRFGIIEICSYDDLERVMKSINRIAYSSCSVKLLNHKGDEIYRGDLETLSQPHSGDFPVDMIVDAEKTGRAFEEFADIIARLRAPDGCPWDREQTHSSLRGNLLGESYEALEAIDNNDITGMREELGDILLQVVLHAQIGYENNEFDLADVIKGVHDKIVSRHPHVFGTIRVDGVSSVLKNWEKIKELERQKGKKEAQKGLLDSIPSILPALARAQELQGRAARVNFDWKEIHPVMGKVEEELNEVKHAENPDDRKKELGDLLFAVVNLIRWYKEDAESVLREANQKFVERFHYIELQAKKQGRIMTDLSFEEMDDLWNQAKKNEIGQENRGFKG